MKPLLRYVGGKTRLLPHIYDLLGKKPIRDYYEPCVGGGAVFFDLVSVSPKNTPCGATHRNDTYDRVKRTCYLNDINTHLMAAYSHVRDNLGALTGYLEALSGKVEGFEAASYENIKASFNANKVEYGPYRAAQFIALNHMSFNALWRENKKGEMNTPIGKSAKSAAYPGGKPRSMATFNWQALQQAHDALQGVNLDAVPLSEYLILNMAPSKGDFVFYDPPYLEEFSQYSKQGFGLEEHRSLASQAKACAARGARVIVCGANRASSHEIYGKPTRVIALNRTVGCKDRGLATEALYCYGKFT
jgi:DNA adenine methylase